jgi:hypothetical protein
MTKVKIVLDELNAGEARALVQMAKRMIWDDFRRLSAGRAERDDVDAATPKLERALAEAGFDPR